MVSRITFQSLLFNTVHTFDIQIVISTLKSTDIISHAVDSEPDIGTSTVAVHVHVPGIE